MGKVKPGSGASEPIANILTPTEGAATHVLVAEGSSTLHAAGSLQNGMLHCVRAPCYAHAQTVTYAQEDAEVRAGGAPTWVCSRSARASVATTACTSFQSLMRSNSGRYGSGRRSYARKPRCCK